MAMLSLGLAWILAAVAAIWWWRQGSTVSGKTPTPLRTPPHRSLNPRALSAAFPGTLWELRGDPDCSNTQGLGRRRVSAEQAVDLHALGCDIGLCHCHYRPVAEPRRRPRRCNDERREQFRFAADADRRDSNERRFAARPWSNSARTR